MDYVEISHQMKHPQHLNHPLHHHHHVQQQANPHDYFHQLTVAGVYPDSGGCFVISDANAVSGDHFSHIEMEKQSLPHNLYDNQCPDISVQMFLKACEDAHVSVNTHEESRFPSKPCKNMHSLPGKHQNQPFLNDGRHSQRQLQLATRALDLVRPQVRLLCSTGGKIMGRPVDGKLRYCGGDTRLINVEHGIRFSDFVTKLSQMYGPGLILKYNLPGEDLDALVSVSSDDDLQNMLDEYDRMVANGNHAWLRLFVFRNQSDLEAASCFDCGNGRAECCSQIMQRYIDIINGFDARETSGQPMDWMVDDCSNGCLSTARMSSDTPHIALRDPSSTMNAFLVAPSASPSVPSSPSGASRQVHYEQCGTDETCFSLSKEEQNSLLLMNGLGRNTQELAQDHNIDVLKCDHYQSHIPGESPKMQQAPSHHRCNASSLKANGMRLGDTDVQHVYQHECCRGRGTGYVDTWHGLPRARGLVESACGPQCGYHLVSQPLNSMACHKGVVDNAFCRCEPSAQFYGEGHKQFLHPNLLHQTGPLVIHGEGLVRSQKGSVYQIADGQQLPHFIKEPLQIPLQNASITGPIAVRTMGSTPSSPRHVFGSCCRHHQHAQVDRGINVSLEEDSCSQKPPYSHGLTIRKHGVPFYCSFSDGPNFCSDSGELYCVPTLEKCLESDKREFDAFSRMHTFPKNNTFCQQDERSAKENIASSLMEPIHSLREGSPSQYEICCADFHDAQGLQLDKAKFFPVPEGHVYMGQPDPCSGNHKETTLSGALPRSFKSEASLERAGDTVMGLSINYGDGNLNVQNGLGASGYTHVHGTKLSPAAGHKGHQYGLKSQSFCSTDANVGSFSSLSLEPGVWVNSSSTAIPNDHSKKREGHECSHFVDFGLDGSVKHEVSGDISRLLSFDCMDCHTRASSRKSSANSVESSIEISPVLSFATMTEDKNSTLTETMLNVSYLYGSEHNFDDDSCPLMCSQPFPLTALEPDGFGESATLPISVYDQSPRSSGGDAPLFLSGSDSKSVSLEKKAREPCANNNIAFMTSHHQNHGQYQEMAEIDVESTSHRIYEYEGKPMSEESRTNSKPSSRCCSVASELKEKDSEIGPDAQSQETDQILQEVSVSGSVDACPEYDEKGMPPSQAEAEAIARGLQIIKNDDLEDLKELGSGTYGTVFHGRWKGSDVAIKRIKPSFFMGSLSEQERMISDFWREAGTLSQLHHPNIVAFYGVVPDGPERSLANVTEYMVNGSLKQVLMKKDRTIDRRKRLLIAMDAAFGMEYLHSKRIIHFDLKSENLFVNMRDVHRPICKVGDFGLSKVKQQTLVSGGVRGTLPWMAPELLSTKGRVTEKVDVYSFGIVMWELLTGEQPYANMHCGTIIGGVVNEDLRPVIPSWCDTRWRHLMERCWSGNPVDRPDFSTVASELRGIASSMNVK